jgi:N6-adenosine-specific RNA methylase IME4
VVGNAGRGAQDGRAATITQTDVLTHYKVMSIEEIKALPVAKHVEHDAHLYLWTTNSFMVEAHEVVRAWGFEPKTIITWVKTQKNHPTQPSMKTGYWYRSATEHVLFAVRGSLRLCGSASPTAVLSPRLPHSVKPQWCYELIEQQSAGPYLELFARKIRAGWNAWGDQIQSTFDISLD